MFFYRFLYCFFFVFRYFDIRLLFNVYFSFALSFCWSFIILFSIVLFTLTPPPPHHFCPFIICCILWPFPAVYLLLFLYGWPYFHSLILFFVSIFFPFLLSWGQSLYLVYDFIVMSGVDGILRGMGRGREKMEME